MILFALSLTVAAVTSTAWTGVEQAGETVPVPIYFYLNFPDRSTQEHWQGERLERATLQQWSRGLAAAIADGSTALRPVETRQEAKVVIEIRRCQVSRDTEFVIGGIIESEAISEPFLIVSRDSPASLQDSVQGLEETIRRIDAEN